MEPDFKSACKAIREHFDVFAEHFVSSMRNGVFSGSVEDFQKAKHKIELIEQMKLTIKNETIEENTL